MCIVCHNFVRLFVFCREIPGLVKEENYIVFKSRLLPLFHVCPVCGQSCVADVKYTQGTLMCIQQNCIRCKYTSTWSSQPKVNKTPAGNLLLSGAILASGLSYVKTLRMLQCLNVATISDSTFLNHWQTSIQPSVYNLWKKEQREVVEAAKQRGGGLSLAGDGRVDSPGHCGKFGSYTVIDMEANKIINRELVQV